MDETIYDELPPGYRWATDEEAENAQMWDNVPGSIEVRRDGTEWTDYAVPDD